AGRTGRASRNFLVGRAAAHIERTLKMAEQTASGRATWFVIAIVLLGVLIVGNLPGHQGQASDGSDHPRLAALMGSAQRSPETRVFSGAEMTALMGSCVLDLR